LDIALAIDRIEAITTLSIKRPARVWAGLRPVSPTGTPIIGETRVRGLWANAGHGHLGWTMACGSGRVLADLMHAKDPTIPLPESQGCVV